MPELPDTVKPLVKSYPRETICGGKLLPHNWTYKASVEKTKYQCRVCGHRKLGTATECSKCELVLCPECLQKCMVPSSVYDEDEVVGHVMHGPFGFVDDYEENSAPPMIYLGDEK